METEGSPGALPPPDVDRPVDAKINEPMDSKRTRLEDLHGEKPESFWEYRRLLKRKTSDDFAKAIRGVSLPDLIEMKGTRLIIART